ncbi:hypothetical protein THAOC_21683 [Thalassiosira oceanica]|uniref:50S ribosomal protein L19, chloroplastic n=1 Tax=Thalassiosira oceanica TaxID=159749 RepID=K0SBD7_THAOC|nr:hypothetical protein THAOC_21683 [Thalassiosira oceanica]|eukprot:EJK58211.1 hypothetical protein THAOC_21683 [Thalassiosira oceanica]
MFSRLVRVQQQAVASTQGTALCSSSQRPFSSRLPPITTPLPLAPHQRSANSEQIDKARQLITNPSHTRSRRGNGWDKRTFPVFRTLPTNERYDFNKRVSTENAEGKKLKASAHRFDTGVSVEEMPFLHFQGHEEKPKPKFKSPRKRASKLFNELQVETVANSTKSKPAVWEVPFKVGDAVELEILDSGGVDNPNNRPLEKIRGVVLGRHNKGLDTSINLRDVLFGEPVERKVKLHSPLVKSLKVLEEGFVNRGRRKGRRVKRAKLYYLRDRKPEETRVTNLKSV